MNRSDTLRHHALATIAVAALALAGCNRHTPEPSSGSAGPNGSNESTTTAANSSGGTSSGNGSGSAATGSPGMSGSPGAGGRDTSSTTAGDLNAMPSTAAGSVAAASGVPGSSADSGGTTQALDAGDRKFVTEAAAGGMFEVQVSKLAADKATDPAVKQFASMLVTDHSNANDQLKAFASAHNVTLPSTLPKDKQAQIDKLQKASGKDFDKQYAQTVGIKDHKEDIAKFEKASQAAKNPELKAWVDKTLPTLKEHLAAAQKLPENGAKTANNS
jgi:putative membrane protein